METPKLKKFTYLILLIPKINYEFAYDEIRLLKEEGIKVHKKIKMIYG